jgi:hypothetical protein
MLRLILVLCVCGWFFTSCSSSESKSKDATVAGVYVREYSSEILNQLSGNKVGMRIIRDTLYIKQTDKGYRIENAKWQMNDYDDEGWENMEHSESAPLPSYDATYDKQSRTLTSEMSGALVPDLVLQDDGKLSVGSKSKIPYTKID